MVMMTWVIVFYGGLSLIFGVWTLAGLVIPPRSGRRRSRKWVLGVCADFSFLVGIPLWVVRLYALVFLPVLLGIPFYFLYYWMMRHRRRSHEKSPSSSSPPQPQVTRIQSHYYRK